MMVFLVVSVALKTLRHLDARLRDNDERRFLLTLDRHDVVVIVGVVLVGG